MPKGEVEGEDYITTKCDDCSKVFKCYGIVACKCLCNRCYKKRICVPCKLLGRWGFITEEYPTRRLRCMTCEDF